MVKTMKKKTLNILPFLALPKNRKRDMISANCTVCTYSYRRLRQLFITKERQMVFMVSFLY